MERPVSRNTYLILKVYSSMQLDLNLIATNNINLQILSDQDRMIEHYLFEEADGNTSIEGYMIDSLETCYLLFRYLFTRPELPAEFLRNQGTIIFDFSHYKNTAVSVDDLDKFYQDWIKSSGRESNMDEYGMFLGLIGYIQRHNDKKHLIAAIYER